VPNYTGATANNAFGTVNALGLSNNNTFFGNVIDSVNHRLFVTDTTNNRVLVFNLDTNNNLVDKTPDNVLGQANFTTATANNTQSGMNSPSGLAYDATNQRLFVAEYSGHRVKVWDVTAITDGENAINVLGQANFTTATAANSQSGMNGPIGLAYDATNQRLFVSENTAHRVKVWDVTAITDGENAINVLGQTTFTGASATTTQSGMNAVHGITFDATNQRLFVAQVAGANRVTVYDVASIIDGENAVNVL
jgi:6-phosphogluconolactonase (cycloisomerase 2 family)